MSYSSVISHCYCLTHYLIWRVAIWGVAIWGDTMNRNSISLNKALVVKGNTAVSALKISDIPLTTDSRTLDIKAFRAACCVTMATVTSQPCHLVTWSAADAGFHQFCNDATMGNTMKYDVLFIIIGSPWRIYLLMYGLSVNIMLPSIAYEHKDHGNDGTS